MPDSAVSSPTASTRTRRLPPAATEPAMTLSPGPLVTAFDSPVMIDSSTSAVPSTTVPSTGTRAPGRTRTRSSTFRSASGTVSVASPLTRSAVSGRSAARAARAPWAWAIERISSQWPSSMIVMRVASSHQISTSKRPSVPAQLVTKATMMASEIRVIIPGCRSRSSPDGAADEDQAAVQEDDRSEDRRDEVGARERRGRVAEPLLGVAAPDDDRDRQEQAQPELVAEHRHRMAGMAIVGGVPPGGESIFALWGRGDRGPSPPKPRGEEANFPPTQRGGRGPQPKTILLEGGGSPPSEAGHAPGREGEAR